jgi:hypothetical protein
MLAYVFACVLMCPACTCGACQGVVSAYSGVCVCVCVRVRVWEGAETATRGGEREMCVCANVMG